MPESPREFHKPVRRPAELLDRLYAGTDPADVSRIAHSTAVSLLTRVRAAPDVDVVERLLSFTRQHGIDDVAELWSQAPARSLPGALWRLYLLHLMIHDDPSTAALLYARGVARLESADPVIAGAPTPAGPDELVSLVDTILRGLFTGDFAIALERAAAFARVQASGALDMAADYERTETDRARSLASRALRLTDYAADLDACATLWRRESLT